MIDGTAEAWATDFDTTFPVITDNSQDIARNYTPSAGGQFGIPMYAVLDRELRVVAKNLNSSVANQVASLLEDDMPEVDWLMPDEGETTPE
jgi:glutamate formiminotransferase